MRITSRHNLKLLIGEHKIVEVFNILIDSSLKEDKNTFNDLILIKSKFEKHKKDSLIGVITINEFNTVQVQIGRALLYIIDILPNSLFNETPKSNSKKRQPTVDNNEKSIEDLKSLNNKLNDQIKKSEDIYSKYSDNLSSLLQNIKKSSGINQKNATFSIKLSLLDIRNGGKKIFEYPIKRFCNSCNGNGMTKGLCNTCNGSGKKNMGLQKSFDNICNDCLGTGKTIFNTCLQCNGKGSFVLGKESIKISIPKGVPNGHKLRVPKSGNYLSNGSRTDLIFYVKEEKDSIFTRMGDDIHCKINLTPQDALNGGEAHVKTLDGEVKIKIEPMIKNGKKIRLKGKGLPNFKTKLFGSQIIKINVLLSKK